MVGAFKCPFCNVELAAGGRNGYGFCTECKRGFVITDNPAVIAAHRAAAEHLDSIKMLFVQGQYDQCIKKVDGTIIELEDCPDIWFVKSILSMNNLQKYNFCTCKARSLIQQRFGLIAFTMEEVEQMKRSMPAKNTGSPPEKPK